MLVLTRKKDDKIIIDGQIEITVLEIGNGRVKLGFKAPEEIEIVRGELYTQVEEENLNATKRVFLNLDELKEFKGVVKGKSENSKN